MNQPSSLFLIIRILCQIRVRGKLILRNGIQFVLIVHIFTHIRTNFTVAATFPVPVISFCEFAKADQVCATHQLHIHLTGSFIQNEVQIQLAVGNTDAPSP